MWPHSGWAIAWSIFRGAYHVFMSYVITFFLDYVRARQLTLLPSLLCASVKRDLHKCQKRPVHVAEEA